MSCCISRSSPFLSYPSVPGPFSTSSVPPLSLSHTFLAAVRCCSFYQRAPLNYAYGVCAPSPPTLVKLRSSSITPSIPQFSPRTFLLFNFSTNGSLCIGGSHARFIPVFFSVRFHICVSKDFLSLALVRCNDGVPLVTILILLYATTTSLYE